MGMKRWTVGITSIAEKQLAAITDRRIQNSLKTYLRRLEYEPEKKGKALSDELTGFRSIRAIGQSYRIIYKVEAEKITVVVVTLGMRKDGDKKDVYELAKKLARLGLLNNEAD